jgi:hypothetical protein
MIKAVTLLGFLLAVWAVDAAAQGTLNFSNLDPAVGLDAPIAYDWTLFPPERLGRDYVAELLAGPTVSQMRSLAISYLTNGYIESPGIVTVPNRPPGESVWCVLQAYRDSFGSFSNAYASGMGGTCGSSGPFKIVLGGSVSPPSPAAALVGLYSFDVGLAIYDYFPFPLDLRLTSTNTLYLSWNGMGPMSWRYVLQESTDMKPGHWYNVAASPDFPETNSIFVDPNRLGVAIAAPQGPRFYRLFRPLYHQ